MTAIAKSYLPKDGGDVDINEVKKYFHPDLPKNISRAYNKLLRSYSLLGEAHTLIDKPLGSTRINNELLRSYNVDYVSPRFPYFNYRTFLRPHKLRTTVSIPRKYGNKKSRLLIKNGSQKSKRANFNDESVSPYSVHNVSKSNKVNENFLRHSHLSYNYNTVMPLFILTESNSKTYKLNNNTVKLRNYNHKNVTSYSLSHKNLAPRRLIHKNLTPRRRLEHKTLSPPRLSLETVTSRRLDDKNITSRQLNLKIVVPHRSKHTHSKRHHLFHETIIQSRLNHENITPRRLYNKKLSPLSFGKKTLSPHIFRKAYAPSHIRRYFPSRSIENIDTLDRPLRSEGGRKQSYESEYLYENK